MCRLYTVLWDTIKAGVSCIIPTALWTPLAVLASQCLQFTITVECGAEHYTTLECRAVHYTTVQCGAEHYSTVECCVVQYSTVECCAEHYSTVECSVVQYSGVLCRALQYSGGQTHSMWPGGIKVGREKKVGDLPLFYRP